MVNQSRPAVLLLHAVLFVAAAIVFPYRGTALAAVSAGNRSIPANDPSGTMIYRREFGAEGTLRVLRRALSPEEIDQRLQKVQRDDFAFPRSAFEYFFDLHPAGAGPPRRLYANTVFLHPGAPQGGEGLSILDARVEDGTAIVVTGHDELVQGVVVTDRVVIPSLARRVTDVLTTGGPANGYTRRARISGSVRDETLVVHVYVRGKDDDSRRFGLEKDNGGYRWVNLDVPPSRKATP